MGGIASGARQQPWAREMGENRTKLHFGRFLQGCSLKQGIGKLGMDSW